MAQTLTSAITTHNHSNFSRIFGPPTVVALLLSLLGLFDAFAVVAAFVAGLAEVHVALVVALMNIVAQKRAVVGYAFIVLIARELGTFFIWAALE